MVNGVLIVYLIRVEDDKCKLYIFENYFNDLNVIYWCLFVIDIGDVGDFFFLLSILKVVVLMLLRVKSVFKMIFKIKIRL